MVGRTDHALTFHALDDAGGAVVADLQIALDEAGAAFALARHQGDRLVVELVALGVLAFAGQAEPTFLGIGIVGHRFDVRRHALGPEVPHHLLDLGVAHEGPVHACDLAAARHVEHVALTYKLLAPLLAQDRTALRLPS